MREDISHNSYSIKMKSVSPVIGAVFLALCFTHVYASDVEGKDGKENRKVTATSYQPKGIKSFYSGRIVNGKNGDIASYPYIVHLRVNNFGACGASIITLKHAFTAAHCLYKNQNATKVRTGVILWKVSSFVADPETFILGRSHYMEAVQHRREVGSSFRPAKSLSIHTTTQKHMIMMRQ